MRELVAQGAIGELGSVYADFRVDMARRLKPGAAYFALSDPLLLDMSIHPFDLIRFTLGEALAVTCSSWNPHGSPFVYAPVADATVTLVSGATVSYWAGFMAGLAADLMGWRMALRRQPGFAHLDRSQRL